MSQKNTLPPIMFKKKTFVVDADDPWKNDKLARKPIAEQLNKIINQVKQPFVMSLTSRYGTGKSTFAKCWEADLKLKDKKTVYFNAWETDYSNNAFTAFVSCLSKEFSESELQKNLIEKAAHFGGALLRNAPGVAISLLLKKLTGANADEFLKDLGASEDQLAEYFKNAADETLRAQKETEDTLETFRESLAEFIQEECDGKLIVFVDELDRCRPNYAVEVLERIKHFFSVKGLVFVLCVDRDQLLNSISGVYGHNLDALGYYRKFVDWDYFLPAPSQRTYVNYLWRDVFDFQYPNLDWDHDHLGESEIITLICIFCELYNLSLRSIGQLFTKLNLAFQSNLRKQWGKNILPFCVLLMHCEEGNYKQIANLQIRDEVKKSEAYIFLRKFSKFCDSNRSYADFGSTHIAYLSSLLSYRHGPTRNSVLVMDGDWRSNFRDPKALLFEIETYIGRHHTKLTEHCSPSSTCIELLDNLPTV